MAPRSVATRFPSFLGRRKTWRNARIPFGCILRDRRRLNEALLWFRRAVKLGDADANRNVAKLYLEHKANPTLAIRFLKETSKSRNATVGSKQEARKLLTQLKKAGCRPPAR